MQSLYFVTPPREQHTCPIDGSPIIREDTGLFCLSFDLGKSKREGGGNFTKGERRDHRRLAMTMIQQKHGEES
jgi:hypothetical protein